MGPRDLEGQIVAGFRKTSSFIFGENNKQVFKKKYLFQNRSNVETV